MRKFRKVMMIILAIISTIAFVAVVIACIQTKMDRWGGGESRSARDFFMAMLAIAVVLSIPTILFWVKVFKTR